MTTYQAPNKRFNAHSTRTRKPPRPRGSVLIVEELDEVLRPKDSRLFGRRSNHESRARHVASQPSAENLKNRKVWN